MLTIMKKNYGGALLATALLCSCAQPASPVRTASPVVIPSRTVDGPAPWTGLVLWQTNGEIANFSQAIALEFSYFRFDQVASDGVNSIYAYDWTAVHDFLDQAAARGHHGILRFKDTDPLFTDGPGLPSSLCAGKITAVYNEGLEGGSPVTVSFPDWSNPELARFYVDFYANFAREFDDDPALAYVEVGFGLWAEYHVDFSNLSDFSDSSIEDVSDAIGKIFPSEADQATILRAIDADLVGTPWGISIDSAAEEYGSFDANPALLGLGFGVFDDSFLCEGGNADNWNFFSKSTGTMNGGEISYYTVSDQTNALSSSGPNGVSLAEYAKTRAMSFLIGDGQTDNRTPQEIAAAGKSMGYRLAITDASTDGASTTVTIRNDGVAGVFFDVYPSIGRTVSPTNLKGLAPGQAKTCVIGAPYVEGSFSLDSPRLVSGQSIPYGGN